MERINPMDERTYMRRKQLETLIRPRDENDFIPIPNWGGLQLDGIEYSIGLCCPACGWQGDRGQSFESMAAHIVGLSHDCPLAGFSQHRDWEDTSLGALIFECPNDFSKFWFHARGMTLLFIIPQRDDLYDVVHAYYSKRRANTS